MFNGIFYTDGLDFFLFSTFFAENFTLSSSECSTKDGLLFGKSLISSSRRFSGLTGFGSETRLSGNSKVCERIGFVFDFDGETGTARLSHLRGASPPISNFSPPSKALKSSKSQIFSGMSLTFEGEISDEFSGVGGESSVDFSGVGGRIHPGGSFHGSRCSFEGTKNPSKDFTASLMIASS